MKIFVVSRQVGIPPTGIHFDAIFTTREAAEEYRRHVEGPFAPTVTYGIGEWEADLPRGLWPGAWIAVVRDDGTEVCSYWSDRTSPSTPPAEDVKVDGRFVFFGYGETREEALTAAQRFRVQVPVGGQGGAG